jgi:hypothetical protein
MGTVFLMTHSTLPAWTAWAVSHDREVHFYSVILGFLGTGALTNPEGSQPNWLKCPVQQGRRPLHYPSRNPTEQRPPVPINPESVLSPPSTLVRARTHTLAGRVLGCGPVEQKDSLLALFEQLSQTT